MAKIDDPEGQLEERYLGNESGLARRIADGLIEKGLIPAIPKVGWLFALIQGFLKSESTEAKLRSFQKQIIDLVSAYREDQEEFQKEFPSERHLRLIAVGVERILWGANEEKVKRFAAVVAHVVAFEQDEREFEDAASFIRALNELSEMDIKVLDHLYTHQKDLIVEGVESHAFFADYRMRKVLDSTHELGVQVEDFYARCGRLSAYGLVLPLEKPNGTDASMFAFRITRMGKKLIEMLKRGKVALKS
jgi:hypothetical protein